MKNLDKIKLIDMIASSLQDQMTFAEIDSYFKTYNIPTDHTPSYNSKKVYVKEVLPSVSDKIILEISDELKLEHSYGKIVDESFQVEKQEESSLWNSGQFKLFISHLSSFKVTIAHLKNELEKYGISSFVAHEDIEPAKEWQNEIEKSLFSMDALCAVLMPGFNESNWTDQEIGVAIGRKLLVIPVRKGKDPYGFIGKFQGIQSNGKNVGQVAEAIFKIISSHEKTKSHYINIITDLLLLSTNETDIKNRIDTISKIKEFPLEKAKQIKTKVLEKEVFNQPQLMSVLNSFFKDHGLNQVQSSDFDRKQKVEYEDLPF